MKVVIYEIINLINHKEYIGQTIQTFERRINTHINNLNKNKHKNNKLQNAWNKYGQENFAFVPHYYDINNENYQKELDKLEIDWIAKKDSYNNGYNLTPGGQGGLANSPNQRKLNFEQYCIAFLGNSKYKGLMGKTGKWFNCDSSCISAIINKNAYADFRDKLEQLPNEEKQQYLTQFEEHFKDCLYTSAQKPKIDNDLTFEILCVVSCYSRGTENAILKKFNLSKSFVINCFRMNSHKEAVNKLKNTSKEDIQKIGTEKFKEWELIKYNTYLKFDFTDLFEKYKKYL